MPNTLIITCNQCKKKMPSSSSVAPNLLQRLSLYTVEIYAIYARRFFTDPHLTPAAVIARKRPRDDFAPLNLPLGDSSKEAGVLVPKESDARQCVVASCRLGPHGALQSLMEEECLPLVSLSIRCGPVFRWPLTVRYCGTAGYCKGRLHGAGHAERQSQGHRSREERGPGK